MVVLVIILYLLFVSLFLFKKQKIKPKIKTFKHVKGVNYCKKYFCNKGKSFKFYNFLLTSTINFKSEGDFKKFVLPLKKAGLDYTKNIIKIEIYKNFNWEEKKKELLILKNFRKTLNFYTLIFVDNSKNLDLVKSYLDKINFKLDTKIYYCLDVDYKLLSSINFFDINFLNYTNNLNYSRTFHFGKRNYKVKQNFLNTNTNLPQGFSLNFLPLDKFSFKNTYMNSTLLNNFFNCTLEKTFNYKLMAEIYFLKILNKSDSKKSFNFSYLKTFKEDGNKYINVLNFKNGINFVNKNTNTKVMFSNFFTFVSVLNNSILLTKNIVLNGKEEKSFYFVKFLNNFNPIVLPTKTLFLNTKKLYDSVFKINVLSSDTNINNLINTILPQKIIEEVFINCNKGLKDFTRLLNLEYSENLVEKSLISVPISNFNLINKNFYSVYFNLIFFYFGIWKTQNNAVILNLDKSLILEDSKIFFKIENDKTFLVKNKKENLKNEIKINNVNYTNLKFLNCNKFLCLEKPEIEIVF